MSKQFYLSNNGAHVGPFDFEAVVKRIDSLENQATDYIYDETLGDWVMLIEHPEFSGIASKQRKAPAPAPVVELKKSPEVKFQDKEWFILKDGNNYGPFAQVEIVQMLQEKALYEFDYIWHSKLAGWMRVSEVEEYSPESIRQMKLSSDAEVSEVFFRRRHARASYGASLIVHDNKTVFKGRAMEISAGGAGIVIETPSLNPGQSLFLHFQPGDGVPPFNAVCQIVSKQYVKEGFEEGKVRYGVKFTTLPQSVRDSIKTYTSHAA